MLKKLRKDINGIDSEIIRLLSKRQKISREIGKYKKKNNIKVVDNGREKKVLGRVYKQARKLKLEKGFIEKIFKLIIFHSRRAQKCQKQ
jgi:chorismate mutase